jgi:ABC-type bacteriocin/lantibiotic exporter with double-glycine peptidase domain
LVLNRQLTLGQLVAAELVVSAVIAGLLKLSKLLENYYDLAAAADKIGHIVDLPLERGGGEKLTAIGTPMRLKVDDLSYSFNGHRQVLQSVAFEAGPGEHVAITGPEGAGKTALVELLYGLLDHQAGQIRFDGIEMASLSLHDLRQQIGLVSGVEVFEGTVLENVQVGRPNIGLDEVREALSEVELLEEILSLPDGLHTHLATGGPQLSQGQLRRLMVARAIASKPRLLIIDEALDGLPLTRDCALSECLFGKNAPWTVVAISRASWIQQRCARVYRLDNGVLERVDPSGEKR